MTIMMISRRTHLRFFRPFRFPSLAVESAAPAAFLSMFVSLTG